MRCKMRLNEKTAGDYSGQQKTKLSFAPVFSEDPESENKKYWDATPSGELRLDVVNAAAVEGLEVGKEYYVDVTPAE